MHLSRKNKGFTLLEVAIGLAVIGILMGPILQAYMQYRTEQIIFESKSAQGVIRAALKRYVLHNGHYPLPTAYNLKPGDTGFGREYTGTISACPAAGVAMNTVCRTVVNTANIPATPAADAVLIGAVPFAALGLPGRYLLDGRMQKFTYAITENLTRVATFNNDHGAVLVRRRDGALDIDENGHRLHYAIVSHGQNGVGAYRLSGTLIASCIGSGQDRENCNNDGTFKNNFFHSGGRWVSFMSLADNSEYFDDFISYNHTIIDDIWSINPNPTSLDISSRNAGRVFVGPVITDMPAKLSVNGGDVRADRLRVEHICKRNSCETASGANPSTSPNAWYPKKFTAEVLATMPTEANAIKGGGGIYCGRYRALTGIANTNEECGLNRFPTSYYTNFNTSTGLKRCATGLWPKRTNSSGQIICEAP